MKKNIGIIGFGETGMRLAMAFRLIGDDDIDIAGVVEPDEELYRRGCEWHNQEFSLFGSVQELMDYVEPDGIVIAAPPESHLEILEQFGGYSVPIFLVTPLEASLENTAEIVRFAQAYSAPVVAGPVARYAPVMGKARELLASGRIGKLRSFQFLGPAGVHNLNLGLFLTGAEPLSVSMAAGPDSSVSVIRFDNGVFGSCACGGGERLWTFDGSQGFMRIAPECGEIKVFPSGDSGLVETYQFDYFGKPDYNGGAFAARYFYDLLCGREAGEAGMVWQAFAAELVKFAAELSMKEDSRYVRLAELMPDDLAAEMGQG